MSETFQVVAATSGRDEATVLRLADAIGARFSVDLSALIGALSETGVGVASASSLREARAMGTEIIALGADYSVLDEAGEEVDAGQAKALVIEPRRPAGAHRTMMGGFSAPELADMIGAKGGKPGAPIERADGGFSAAGSTIGEGAVDMGAAAHVGKLELDGPGGFAHARSTIGAGAVTVDAREQDIELDDGGGFAAKDARIAEGAVDLGAAKPRKLEFDDGGGFAAPDATITRGAVGLGAAEALSSGDIELDGPGGFAHAHSTIGEGAVEVAASSQKIELDGPGGFAAPAKAGKAGFDLDALDVDALVMLDGTSEHPAVGQAAVGQAARPGKSEKKPAKLPKPGGRQVDEASFLPPEATDQGAALELDEIAPPKRPAQRADLPPPAAETELEWTAATEEPAADSPAPDAAAPARPRRVAPRPLPSGPLLLGGKLRSWPLVRVAAGFVLALGLSSLLPMCHARSVRHQRIEPLRIDLATAKAHGSALAATPGYRTPAQIESDIDSLRTRHGIYTVMMWSALAALLLFLWFRFT